jgi:hypothetical protein
MAITKASSNAVAPAAKGDLVVGNATNDSGVLAVGTTDQVLTVDSTTATGLKWATASAGGMTIIASGSLAASITGLDLTSISSIYTDLKLYITDLSTSSLGIGNSFRIRLNNSSGSVYSYNSFSSANSTLTNSTNNTEFIISGIPSAGDDNSFNFEILNYSNTTSRKTVNWQTTMHLDSPTGTTTGFGAWGATPAAVNRITMYLPDGVFDGGSYILYGVK